MVNKLNILTLAELKAGQKGCIIYTEEYGRGLVQHLADMGLSEGSVIEVITPGNPGPFLIEVKDTSLAALIIPMIHLNPIVNYLMILIYLNVIWEKMK
jgi:Fe2+ transport system protein FeoA